MGASLPDFYLFFIFYFSGAILTLYHNSNATTQTAIFSMNIGLQITLVLNFLNP
jgi:hypothetical protein